MDDLHSPEFPFVISDADGVVDRVATQEEADEYIASMPDETLTISCSLA